MRPAPTLSQVLACWCVLEIAASAFASPTAGIFEEETGVLVEVTTNSSFVKRNASERLASVTKVARLSISSELRLPDPAGVLSSAVSPDRISGVNAPLLRAVSSSSGVEIWMFDTDDGGNRVKESAFRLACAALEQALNLSCTSGEVHAANFESNTQGDNNELTGQSLERVLPGSSLRFQHMFVSRETLAGTRFNFLGRDSISQRLVGKIGGAARNADGDGVNDGADLLRRFHMTVTVEIVEGIVRLQRSLDSVQLAQAQRENVGLQASNVRNEWCASLKLTWREDNAESVRLSGVLQGSDQPNGEKANFLESVSIARRLTGRGFHRVLHSSIEIPATAAAIACPATTEREATSKLRLAILELVGTGFYIDLDEARNLARHAGPVVRGVSEYIDVERPQYRSCGSLVAVEAQSLLDQSPTLSAQIQCPVHFRYHQPLSAKEAAQSNGGEPNDVVALETSYFRDVTIPAPLVFWTCVANTHASEWQWLPIASLSGKGHNLPNSADDGSLFGNAVPVGRDDDYAVVMVGTLMVLTSSAAAVLWVAFSFDSDPRSAKKQL